MDAKITKSRLGHMLSYDWIKILALCAVAVIVWVLLFTTLAPRATAGQTFEIYCYPNTSMTSRGGDLGALHKSGALSGDVLDISVNELTDDGLTYTLPAHFSAGQGDVMFVSSYRYEAGKDEEDNPVYTSDLEQFVAGYTGYCVWLGEEEFPIEGYENNLNTYNYLESCRAYLAKYYPDGLDGEQDKAAVERDFRARIKGDNRYKRESQIAAGLIEEYSRLARLCEGYENVLGYLQDGTVSVQSVPVSVDADGDGTEETVELQVAFDLGNVPGLEHFVVSERSEDGVRTSAYVSMVVLNIRMQEEALRYEQITYLDSLVKESARLLAEES